MTTRRRRIEVEEAAVYGLLTAIGGYAFITAFDYDLFNEGHRVGPGLVPAVLGALVALISGAMLALTLTGREARRGQGLAEVAQSVAPDLAERDRAMDDGPAGTDPDLDIFGRTAAQRMRQLQMVTVALVAAMLLVPVVGLLGALGLFSLFASVVVERRPWLSSVVITAVSVTAVYGLFAVFLEVPLPGGVLGIGGA